MRPLKIFGREAEVTLRYYEISGMTRKPAFECPVCCGCWYNPVITAVADAAPRVYACACCGFTFVDPSRYRSRRVPYSMLPQAASSA